MYAAKQIISLKQHLQSKKSHIKTNKKNLKLKDVRFKSNIPEHLCTLQSSVDLNFYIFSLRMLSAEVFTSSLTGRKRLNKGKFPFFCRLLR